MRNTVSTYNQGIADSTENFEPIQKNIIEDETIKNFNTGTQKMINNADNLRNRIINLQEKIEKHKMNIGNKMEELDETSSIIKSTKKEIQNKIDILDNCNKQLQDTIDQNIFLKKVSYTLLAAVIIVIAIFLLIFSISGNKTS